MRHDVYNLYGRDLHGSYVFESLEDFANGNYDVYNLRTPARGYDIDDTAAAPVYTQVSPFLQDTWQVNDNLSLKYGVRITMPQANKAPDGSQGFEEAFGFRNDFKLRSRTTVAPHRFAITYRFATERMSPLSGGLGSLHTTPP